MYHAALTQPTIACLEMARRLAPPQVIIHVGAGLGQGALHQWHQWPVPQALVIDADGERLQWLRDLTATQAANHTANWQAVEAMVADRQGSVELHATSLPAEDGLLPVHVLQRLWPNLRSTGSKTQNAQTLDGILSQHPLTTASDHSEQTRQPAPILSTRSNWLVVECLPAQPVLQGAIHTLGTVSTVCLRVLTNTSSAASPPKAVNTDTNHDLDAASASLESATTFLATHGFTCVHVGQTNHPAVGEALFVHSDVPRLSAERSDLRQTVAKLHSTSATLEQEHAEQQQLIAEFKTQLEKQRDEYTAAVSQRDALLQKLERHTQQNHALEADLTQNRQALSDAQTASAAAQKTAQAQLDQLTQEKAAQQKVQAELTAARDTETKAKAELQKKGELLTQTNHALEADLAINRQALNDAKAVHETAQKTAHAQIAQLAQEKAAVQKSCDVQTKLATERQQQLATQNKANAELTQEREALRQTIAENQHRLQLMQQEMVKADAQLELIKDLLLRESGI